MYSSALARAGFCCCCALLLLLLLLLRRSIAIHPARRAMMGAVAAITQCRQPPPHLQTQCLILFVDDWGWGDLAPTALRMQCQELVETVWTSALAIQKPTPTKPDTLAKWDAVHRSSCDRGMCSKPGPAANRTHGGQKWSMDKLRTRFTGRSSAYRENGGNARKSGRIYNMCNW